MFIPMVCFCDIPLSVVGNHIDQYGSYGIGLSKDWGKKNRLSPIHYIPQGSFFETIINSLQYKTMGYVDSVKENFKVTEGDYKFSQFEFYKSFFNLFSYMKIYEDKNNCYYDEREWRWIPQGLEDENDLKSDSMHFFEEHAQQSGFIQMMNDKIASKYKLIFEPKDIRYIIVKQESEILDILNKIQDIKSEKFGSDEIQIVKSKVITSERIKSDF